MYIIYKQIGGNKYYWNRLDGWQGLKNNATSYSETDATKRAKQFNEPAFIMPI